MTKRLCFSLIVALTFGTPAFADVTIKMTTGGKGLGMSGAAAGTAYIKGNKMRSDLPMGSKTQSTIFDLDAGKMYVFESGKKEVDVWDMAEFSKQLETSVNMTNAKATIIPNNQTRTFGTLTAEGYNMEISVPAALGNEREGGMTITLTGPVWIVKNAPGAADYAAFYRAAAEKGWIFGDPRAAKGQPGQARAMTEMYRQFAEIGGIAYESDVQVKMAITGPGGAGGGGIMGGMLGRFGNISMQTKVTDVQTEPLSDELFAPPSGYKLTPRK